jgi:5-(carboxyamino)imidazole ribonucleotide synthase
MSNKSPSLSGATLPILPGATLGILGGGQLGRMFTIAARTMGYKVMVLDPDSPAAGQMADVTCRPTTPTTAR